MMKIVWSAKSADLDRILSRGRLRFDREEAAVRAIIGQIERQGDRALYKLTRKFDRYPLTERNLKVGAPELARRAALCPLPLRRAIDAAIRNIRRYHALQKARDFELRPSKGVRLAQRTLPVESAGIYIPGGTAPLFSSILMTVIPAQAAGVARIAVATPPSAAGLDPAMAYSLRALKVTEIYRLGGAQAVAALALGTRSVKRVDMVAGPGNLYVTLAKKLLLGRVQIDMLAGPSEILVIADASASPAFIAHDLLSQSEHGSGRESSVLLTVSLPLARAVRDEVNALVSAEPVKSPIRRALRDYGLILVLKDLKACAETANTIAPEHLELMVRNPRSLLPLIRNAGAIFLGPWSCESLGDYFAGPSHVLPTNGTARFYSPLSAYHFMKRTSIIEYQPDALRACAPHVIGMAEKEGLRFHAESVRIRTLHVHHLR